MKSMRIMAYSDTHPSHPFNQRKENPLALWRLPLSERAKGGTLLVQCTNNLYGAKRLPSTRRYHQSQSTATRPRRATVHRWLEGGEA